jgi:hypothetical protein
MRFQVHNFGDSRSADDGRRESDFALRIGAHQSSAELAVFWADNYAARLGWSTDMRVRLLDLYTTRMTRLQQEGK